MILGLSFNALAADVCLSRVDSAGITSKLVLQCSGKSAKTLATISEVQGDVSKSKLARAKADMMRSLIENGYSIEADGIFVRR